jgi:hypothetical protein
VLNLSFFDVYVVGSSKKAEQSSHPLIKIQKNKDITLKILRMILLFAIFNQIMNLKRYKFIKDYCSLYYKHIKIVNDASRITLQVVSSL